MNVSNSSRYAVALCVAVAILAGCGGAQSPIGVPATSEQSMATAGYRNATGRAHRATTTTRWTVKGRELLLDGSPFFIKGVDYGTSQIDSLYDQAPVANPLDNVYKGIWEKDLALMRADGVNAVKVYNVTLASFKDIPNENVLAPQQPFPKETGKIDQFLDAAWNNGDHPIYVVLSLQFGGDDVLQPTYKVALSAAYKITASEYGSYPALMGFSIGNEINSDKLIIQPDWWKALNDINASIKAGLREANRSVKITTTTMVDGTTSVGGKDYLNTVYYGEKYGFKVDAWGIDVYRGPTMGPLWAQIERSTTKPTIIAEYGSSAAYYPKSSAKHGTTSYSCINYPDGTDKPPYYGLPPPRPWEGVLELPGGSSANPRMQNLVDYVTTNQKEVFANSTGQGGLGVDSGGFYFEFNDEWWKSGWSHLHIGGFIGNKITKNAEFAGCYDDQAWFGLYSDLKSGVGSEPYPLNPGRNPDIRVSRPTRDAIKAEWAKE
jgi:hypothetical protein